MFKEHGLTVIAGLLNIAHGGGVGGEESKRADDAKAPDSKDGSHPWHQVGGLKT